MDDFETRTATFTKAEVVDALGNIDKAAYPDRYAILLRRYEEVKDDPVSSTPDPMAEYHTGWRRFFAGAIDGILIAVAAGFLFLGVGGAPGITDSESIEQWIHPVYSVWLTWACGWTIGKRVCGVMVVMFPAETPITFKAAALREIFPIMVPFLGLLSTLFPEGWSIIGAALAFTLALGVFAWFILEIVTMLADPHRRAFHDKIAGTVVIKSKGWF